jgi:site-specific DNA-methyltransferase (adenine-specific)
MTTSTAKMIRVAAPVTPDMEIDPEFEKLKVPRTPEEYQQLEESLKEYGSHDPVKRWQGKLVHDMDQREICIRHRIPYTVVDLDLPDRNAVKIFIIRHQLGRPNLFPYQRIELALKLKPLIAARAKKNQRAGGNKSGVGPQKSVEPLDTQKGLAEIAGVSHDTMHKGTVINERASEQVKEQLRRGEITPNAVYKKIQQKEQRKRKLREMKENAAKPLAKPGRTWDIIHGDCLVEMEALEPKSFRLIVPDPPYNIGIDYGGGRKADLRPEEEFVRWTEAWMKACVRLLSDDGSLWVVIGDEYADHVGIIGQKHLNLHRRSRIVWYETFGMNQSNNFNLCSRYIFYFTRSPRQFIFNRDEVMRPSDRQIKYNDKRADPGGKILDNVWTDIPRLVENAKERIPGFPTQLPLKLLDRIVRCASNPGDRVLDCFNGSGTTGVACILGDREYVGIEQSKEFHRLAMQRLRAAERGVGADVERLAEIEAEAKATSGATP